MKKQPKTKRFNIRLSEACYAWIKSQPKGFLPRLLESLAKERKA